MYPYKSMKFFLLAMFVMNTWMASAQQGNPLPIVHQKMKALKWLSGKWEGTAYLLGQDGMKQEVTHYLAFEPRLNGTMYLISEHVMVGQDTLFRNLAFFGYDFLQSKYNLRAFTNGGAQMDAYVEVLDNRMIWRFHAGGQIYRYTAYLNNQSQWHQVGEVSSDEGESWTSFLESTLGRIE